MRRGGGKDCLPCCLFSCMQGEAVFACLPFTSCSERVLLIGRFDSHPLELGELIDDCFAVELAKAAGLDTDEGGVGVILCAVANSYFGLDSWNCRPSCAAR